MNSKERHEARYQRRKAARQLRRDELSKQCGDFEEVFSYKNLFKSGLICCRNVGWKHSTQMHRARLVSRIARVHSELMDGTYASRGFYQFSLMERGKLRQIRSVHISERVVQRNLCDHVITPVFQASTIYDNGASTKNKGIAFALNRFECHIKRHFRKFGMTGAIALFDFHDYFGSASHAPIFYEMERRIHDPKTLRYAKEFISNFGEHGLGLGSQISQNCALMLPNKLDHFIKQDLHIKGYGRYMDDGYLIHEDPEYLKECLKRIKEVCDSLGIQLNEKKTRIVPIRHGAVFLKTKFIITESGKIYRKANKRSIRVMHRKMKKFKKFLDSGRFTLEDLRCSYISWKGHMLRCDNWKTIQRMDRYFKRVFGFKPTNDMK